jgi:hypothetical protein
MSFYQSPCRHLHWVVDWGFWGGCGGEESDDIYAESFKALVVEINKDPCGHFDSVDRLIVELARQDFLFIDPDDYKDREGCEPACRYLKSLKGTPTPGAVHWEKVIKWIRGNHE